ncbi:MAG TPA: ABC transporter ATP-binding protein [Gaiellaceae bacterium]|nr:ABC transporter ATP-binding protein [Gaiellaceae bacterium]
MLRVEDVAVSFDGVPALAGVALELGEGERLAVLGPSGSGKSTLLRTMAGLVRPDAGRVLLDGRDLADVPPHRRGIGLMLQEGALFPHRDVGGNVGFGLEMAGTARGQLRTRTAELLELVGLAGLERRSIGTLSGGERQRVALARSLAPEPRVLLLDEPLGSLDRPLRERLADELVELFERLGLTVVHVTHDVGEAFAIGDRVALMRGGRVVQQAPPDELWARPSDEWVARFLGMRNVRDAAGRRVVIRPEAVRVAPGEGAAVLGVQRRGAVVRLRVRLDDGEELDAVTTDLDHPRAGERVRVDIDPAGITDLDAMVGG